MTPPSIDVFYIVRGADPALRDRLSVFCRSYGRYAAGLPHKLHIVFKGFTNAAALKETRDTLHLQLHDFAELFLADPGFDLGAYRGAAGRADGELICCLNSSSVILGEYWLHKLVSNLRRDGVGLVGCSASYEAPQHVGLTCAPFPNPHLRTNAFAIDRRRFLAAMPRHPVTSKFDAYLFEHGTDSLTAQVQAQGLSVRLVGRDGRGYEATWWPQSGTFRQGDQANLLIGDNQTDVFRRSSIEEKKALFRLAWGDGSVFQVPLEAEATVTSGQSAAALPA